MWASLLDLRGAIEQDGLEAVSAASISSSAEVCLDLQSGLQADLDPAKANHWGTWVIQFDCIVDELTTITWSLSWDGTAASCAPGAPAQYSALLRADFDKMLYICSGTQNVNTIYLGKILTWWRTGAIGAVGDVMLVQSLQRMFA